MAETQDEAEEGSCLLPALDQLPPHFLAFLKENQVPYDAYNLPVIYRFLRVNEKLCSDLELEEIASEFQKQVQQLNSDDTHGENVNEILVEPIHWFSELGHRFLRLNATHRISGTELYQSGKLYGIDISSAAAVVALGIDRPGEHVLDLCCAPGAKLSMISDELVMLERKEDIKMETGPDGESVSEGPLMGSVTGVDIASSRLSACRTLCKKYGLANVRLFLDDACTFNCLAPPNRPIRPKSFAKPSENKTLPLPVFPSDLQLTLPNALTSIPDIPKKAKKAMVKKNGAILDRLFFCSEWTLSSLAAQPYDKVIVDAQCTLDASIRHLLKHNKCGWIDFEGNPTAIISELQKKMIWNAFRLLKPGGALVYSTCSFCTAQNEGVVSWLIERESAAATEPIQWPADFSRLISPGHLPHSVRFYPKHSGTSGMFIAKIRKATDVPVMAETSQ